MSIWERRILGRITSGVKGHAEVKCTNFINCNQTYTYGSYLELNEEVRRWAFYDRPEVKVKEVKCTKYSRTQMKLCTHTHEYVRKKNLGSNYVWGQRSRSQRSNEQIATYANETRHIYSWIFQEEELLVKLHMLKYWCTQIKLATYTHGYRKCSQMKLCTYTHEYFRRKNCWSNYIWGRRWRSKRSNGQILM